MKFAAKPSLLPMVAIVALMSRGIIGRPSRPTPDLAVAVFGPLGVVIRREVDGDGDRFAVVDSMRVVVVRGSTGATEAVEGVVALPAERVGPATSATPVEAVEVAGPLHHGFC